MQVELKSGKSLIQKISMKVQKKNLHYATYMITIHFHELKTTNRLQCRHSITALNAWEITGIIHDRMPNCHLVSRTWMTSQLNLACIHKLCGPLMCLAYFLTCYSWVFVKLGTGRHWNYMFVLYMCYVTHPCIVTYIYNSHFDVSMFSIMWVFW